ncbi:18728_t:CDS:2, partial [Rhizophagus irregularis]
MAEAFDQGIRGTFQNVRNNNTFQREGKKSTLNRLSSDIDIHHLGRLVYSLDLCLPAFREDEIKNANRLFNEKSGMLSRKLDNNSTESKFTTINCKHNVLKRDSKRNSCEVHDGCFSSLQSTNELQGDKFESTKYADVVSGIRCGECPNRRSIGILQTRFGELFRIGTLGNNAWTTDGTPSETCRFIHAHSFPTQESSTIEDKGTVSQVPACAVQNGKTLRYNNNSILVDAFGKSGRSRIGAFIGFKILKDSDPKELTSYITSVSEFGFNHIIIIGEIYSGIVFLDCYGRVFVWEDEGQMVFPLGGSPEEASKRSIGGDKLGWFVENGNVYMYIKKPQ